MYYIYFLFGILSSLVVITNGLTVSFSTQPFAATFNNFTWTRNSSDPADFYLRKVKLDGDDGPSQPSGPVALPSLDGQSGQGTIHFKEAGVFAIQAIDTQNPNKGPFYTTQITVQVNPNATSNGQSSGNGSGQGNSQGGKDDDDDDDNDHDKDGKNGGHHSNHGDDNMQMMKDPTSFPPQSTSTTNDSNSSTNNISQPDVPKIVGIVLGTVTFIFLVIAGLFYFRYRRRRQTNDFQRTMMSRSPGSFAPEMEYQPSTLVMRDEKKLGPLSRNYSHSSNYTARNLSQPQSATYVPSVPPGLAPSLLSPRSDSVGSSISQRRPNEATVTRGRNSGTNSRSTFTLSFSGSQSSGNGSSSIVQFPVPSLPSRARTSRQMMIEEDIQAMQGKILTLQAKQNLTGVDAVERDEELKQVEARVERLKSIHEGSWALGRTDEIPLELSMF
ncbi:hypothetical protein K435DRAFT_737445 [Dendrothele bispora CBS 962.96]|uniref:Uncharacterized protein n=1 Tax=Dendrothele bispora (strain CBS 962.96) TaxID=1314807 RepID=A0A4S8KSN7_DENBC|nr:hypothetical protein K435DRAFT_737445 [Dendrothele bispora CBS 962.96]